MNILKRFAFYSLICLPLFSCESEDDSTKQNSVEGPSYWNIIKADDEAVAQQIRKAMNVDEEMFLVNDTLVVAVSDEVLIKNCQAIAANYKTDELSWFIFRNDCNHNVVNLHDVVFAYYDTIPPITEASVNKTISVNGTNYSVKMAANQSFFVCQSMLDNKLKTFELLPPSTLCTWGAKRSNYLKNFQNKDLNSYYIFISPDLNPGCGMFSDYVYVGFSAQTVSTNNLDLAQTDMILVKGNKTDSLTIARQIPYRKDGEIVSYKKNIGYKLATSFHGNSNLNSDAGGDAIYLYSTNQYTGRVLYGAHPLAVQHYYNEVGQDADNATLFGSICTWSGKKLPSLEDLQNTIKSEFANAGTTTTGITTDFIKLYDKTGSMMDEGYPANFNRNARGNDEIFISIPYVDSIRTIDSKIDFSPIYKHIYSHLSMVEDPITLKSVKTSNKLIILTFDVSSHGNFSIDGVTRSVSGTLMIELQGYMVENSGIKEYHAHYTPSVDVRGWLNEDYTNGALSKNNNIDVDTSFDTDVLNDNYCFMEQFPDGSFYLNLGLK